MCKWTVSAFLFNEEGQVFWDEISVETESTDVNAMKTKALESPWVKELGFEAWMLGPDGKNRYVLI